MKHNNIPTVKYTTIDGQEMINLVITNGRQSAIIDFAVLQRMAKLLNVADIYTIRQRFIEKLEASAHDHESYLRTLEDEVSFHRTVENLRAIEAENFEQTLAAG